VSTKTSGLLLDHAVVTGHLVVAPLHHVVGVLLAEPIWRSVSRAIEHAPTAPPSKIWSTRKAEGRLYDERK